MSNIESRQGSFRDALIHQALSSDEDDCKVALAVLRNETLLVPPSRLRKVCGLHVRTLRRRGLKPAVQGENGRSNLYDLQEALRLAKR